MTVPAQTVPALPAFGVWLPVYGGWLRARGFGTEPSFEECLAVARAAEEGGFRVAYASENFLNCVHGAAHDVIDAWTLIAALARETTRIGLVAALKPAFRPALVAAQMISTADRVSGGRIGLNVACGWWREEFEEAGAAFQAHDDKYAHAAAYLDRLRGIWSGAAGPHRPVAGTGPEVWIGGHSDAALRFAAERADILFLNGMPVEEIGTFHSRLASFAVQGRPLPRIAMNAFVILGSTDAEAEERRRDLLARARPELIALYRDAIDDAGARAWAHLSDDQLIDANGGFAAALVGSAATIRARLAAYAGAGVDLVLCQFPDMRSDTARFGREIIGAQAAPQSFPVSSRSA
jgi:FMNH2-dependent dimethyl sulfone monooxygenase